MERSEPTLIPEWLRNSGTSNGGSSISNSDDRTSLKHARNKSFVNSNGHEIGRSFSSDKTTSSYFRRSSNSNGCGNLRPHSNFGRQHNGDRGISTTGDHRFGNFLDGSVTSFLSKHERDGYRRSHSMVSGKNADTWHKKLETDSSNTLRANASGSIGGVKKTFLQRDFPSLGTEERVVIPEVGRVPSPGLSSAIQSLPIVNGEKWTSALAEVPILVGSNGSAAATPSSTSVALSATTGLNMAEAVTHPPNRGQAMPTLSVGTQRLEELAIKQSRQLIPVTPSTPKTSKNKVVGPLKGNVVKASNVGKLQVLKPAREKNGTAPTTKDSSSPTSSSNSTTAAPIARGQNHKPVFTILEKRPTSQAQSRNEFFNSVRKKSMEISSTSANSQHFSDKAETESVCANTCQSGDSCLGLSLSGNRGDMQKNPSMDVIFSEEEEAAFLRSMGWEENDGDEGGLTEEEINAFFEDVSKYINSKPSPKIFKAGHPKIFPFDCISAGLSSTDAKMES